MASTDDPLPPEAKLYFGENATPERRRAGISYLKQLLAILHAIDGDRVAESGVAEGPVGQAPRLRAADMIRALGHVREATELLDGRKVRIPDPVLIEEALEAMGADSIQEMDYGPARDRAIVRRTNLGARKHVVNHGTDRDLGARDLPELEVDHDAASRLAKGTPWRRRADPSASKGAGESAPVERLDISGEPTIEDPRTDEMEQGAAMLLAMMHATAHDGRERRFATLLAQGWSKAEARAEAGLTESSAKSFLARVRRRISPA